MPFVAVKDYPITLNVTLNKTLNAGILDIKKGVFPLPCKILLYQWMSIYFYYVNFYIFTRLVSVVTAGIA